MLHLVFDLISFYVILKKEAARQTKKARKENIDVEVLNTGSAFKDLQLQYIEESSRLNVDDDHMIFRKDIIVCVKVGQNTAKTEHWVAQLVRRKKQL